MPASTKIVEASNLNYDDKMLNSNSVSDCNEQKIEIVHDSSGNSVEESGNVENANCEKLLKPNSSSDALPEVIDVDDLVKSDGESDIIIDLELDKSHTKKEKRLKLAEDVDELDNMQHEELKFDTLSQISDPDHLSDNDSPVKLKKKLSCDDETPEPSVLEKVSDNDSAIKQVKEIRKFSIDLLEDTDKFSNANIVECDEGNADSDQNSETDSPIKMKQKFRGISDNLLQDTDELVPISIVDHDEKKSNDPDQTSDADSPIKFRKKFRKFSDNSLNNTGEHDEPESADRDQTSDNDSPIKLKKKFRKFSDDLLSADELESTSAVDRDGRKSADLDEIYDTDFTIKLSKENLNHFNELDNSETEFSKSDKNNTGVEENFPDTMNENSNSLDDDNSPVKRPKNYFIRDVKGKELMRQTLSLPYFHLPKPDFREYMNETNRRLEEPLLKTMSECSQKPKLSNKITLKPADNIVFEIGPPPMDKVEPFRKKVLNMMSRCNGLKSDSDDKAAGKRSLPKPIGAERLSWKMKLLNDIAKKKEAALRERNEMLEEVLEVNEENQSAESETEDLTEDDVIDDNFPVTDTLSTPDVDEQDDSLPELPIGYQESNRNDVDEPCEIDKEIESSPFCFSLPSFQPQGGFATTADHSTSITSNVSQINLSFNENESQKENQSLSLFGSSDLLSSNPLSQNDEIVYDKVLAKENLLSSKDNISRDMITADVMDICSGQFPDEDELPKTPPLINISADEDSEGDVSDSNCPAFPPAIESDSDSEDDLRFKRKVLNKKIRPISPIDEESRYGEEDTRVHPASVLLEANSNFNFSKNESEHGSDSEDENNADNVEIDQQNLNYDSEESLIDDGKEVQKAPRNVRDYFENEAELSGEEGSSDEDEHDLDGEDPLIFADDTDVPANDELRDQIGTLHLKHLLDDDDRMIRQVKNHFLEEGELFSDAARQRKFNWSFNQVEAIHNQNSSGSENEEEISETPFHGDKIKWMQENGNKENEDEADHSFDTSFKVGIKKKIATQIVADRATHSFNKRPRNSFLDEEEAKKSFKKIKLDVTNAQGSRVTKNFVFVEANENGSVKKKISNPKNSVDNSVFDLI